MNFIRVIRAFFLGCPLVLALSISSASAQVHGSGVSASSLFDTVINLPTDMPSIGGNVNFGGVAGQTNQVNLSSGGAIGNQFDAREGSEINISGGTVGVNFNAIGENFGQGPGRTSEVNISGGTVGERFIARAAEVNISGGIVERDFTAGADSRVTISGGNIGPSIEVVNGGELEIIGTDFQFQGSAVNGPITVTSSSLNGGVLSGTLADGSAFIFSSFTGDRFFDATLTESSVAIPAPSLAPIVVDGSTGSVPEGLRSGQTLTVQTGGALPENFQAVNSTINVQDGNVGRLELAGGEINISGGTISSFSASLDSVANITGGTVGGVGLAPGAELNVSGGNLEGFSGSSSPNGLDSTFNLSGGVVDSISTGFGVINVSGGEVNSIRIEGGELNYSGGVIRDRRFLGGVETSETLERTLFSVVPSDINLFGTEFFLDGVLINDPNRFLIDRSLDGILSGRLFDGSAISLDLSQRDVFADNTTLTVSVVPEPGSTLFLTLLTIGGLVGRRRKG